MTPAEELAAATDKLDALIAGAAPDWRVVDDNTLALPMIEMPAMIGLAKTSRVYTMAGPNDATTLYIAAMNPLVGKALVEVLRQWQKLTRLDPDLINRIGGRETLELARLINGTGP